MRESEKAERMSDQTKAAILLRGQSAAIACPVLDGGPVPGGSPADGPVGPGQYASLPPHVNGVALHVEAIGDLDEAHGVADVHDADCTESLDIMQRCRDNQYMTSTETTTHISGERCPKTGRSATACDSPNHRNCPDLRRRGAANYTEAEALWQALLMFKTIQWMIRCGA